MRWIFRSTGGGILAGLIWLVCGSGTPSAPPASVVLPPLGRIDAWVWHYHTGMEFTVDAAARDFLAHLPLDATCVIAVNDDSDRELFLEQMQLPPGGDPRLIFLPVQEPLTRWARDRYVILPRGTALEIFLPDPDRISVGYEGDLAVADGLRELTPRVRVIETDLVFEGGNLLFAGDELLAGPDLILDNLEAFEGDETAVRRCVEETFRRKLTVVGGLDEVSPHPHLDMYLSLIGRRRVLLGDPRLAEEYFQTKKSLGIEDDRVRTMGYFTWEEQLDYLETYELIEGELTALGYEVIRIPILHGEGDVVITWNNAVLEERGGRPRAYVPRYGIPLLDEKAYRIWRGQGYDVHPVMTEVTIVHGGGIRCLTNVLDRSFDPAVPPRSPGGNGEVGEAVRLEVPSTPASGQVQD